MIYENLRRKTKEELINMLIQESSNNVDRTKDTLKELWDFKIDYTQENFILICLNSDNKVLKKKVLFKGGLNSAPVDMKYLFHEILTTKRCTRFLVAHNHPSGAMNPSKADIRITDQIKEGADILALNLLDHIIFSERRYYSFLEEEIL